MVGIVMIRMLLMVFMTFVTMSVGDLGKLPAMDVDVLKNRQPDLPLIVRALRTPRSGASSLHRRQQQRDQHADDGDDDQQLNERESVSRSCAHDGPLTGKPNG
jgi:hypothetical protein